MCVNTIQVLQLMQKWFKVLRSIILYAWALDTENRMSRGCLGAMGLPPERKKGRGPSFSEQSPRQKSLWIQGQHGNSFSAEAENEHPPGDSHSLNRFQERKVAAEQGHGPRGLRGPRAKGRRCSHWAPKESDRRPSGYKLEPNAINKH